MSVTIDTVEGEPYLLDSRVLAFSAVLQCLDPGQVMPLEVSRRQMRHIHEFYLMFSFEEQLIEEMFLLIEKNNYSLPQALQQLPYLQEYHSSLEGTSLTHLANVCVQYQFDHLTRLLFKCLGHGYVYQEGREHHQQLGVINAELHRILQQYPSLFQQINTRIAGMFHSYSDALLKDHRQEQQRLSEDQIYHSIFGEEEPEVPVRRAEVEYRRVQIEE